MKKLKILGAILGIGILVKLGIYQICKTLDHNQSSYSANISESELNNFLIKSYHLIEIRRGAEIGLQKDLRLKSIYLEKSWTNRCVFWKLDKVPVETFGQNLVLPIQVESMERLAQYRFLLVNTSDTITLRGNQTKETVYYAKTNDAFKNVEDYQLVLIKNDRTQGTIITRFNLEKEKN